jgi:3-dehydroquinate synthase
MLKHGLISNEKMWAELIGFMDESLWFMDDSQDKKQQATINHKLSTLNQLLADSVKVKECIVNEDPKEHGIRKALNLGHTIGHAFESFAMKTGKPILHGYAVAYGIIGELYLSTVKCGFPQDKLRQTVTFIREHYGQMQITCDDYPELLELMTHDKKNTSGQINFTLLGGIGDIRINQTATVEDIKEALDFYREG